MDPRTQYRQLKQKIIPATHLHHIEDITDQNVYNAVAEVLGGGLITWTVAPTSPASLSVSISNLTGWTTQGMHLRKSAAEEVDLTDDLPGSGYVWVSIFATFSWNNADTVLDGNGNPAVPHRTESVTYEAVAGGANVLPINPGSGAVRVCSIRLHSTTTQITAGMIKTTTTVSGTNTADKLTVLADKMDKAGGTLTGTVYYNDGVTSKSLLFSNSGVLSMPKFPILLDAPNELDFDNHALLVSGVIDTKITDINMQVILNIKSKFYAGGQTVDAGWFNPLRIRWHTDLATVGTTYSEGIYVHHMETAGVRNGKFQVYIIGAGIYESKNIGTFITRFYDTPIEWLAICPMPKSII